MPLNTGFLGAAHLGGSTEVESAEGKQISALVIIISWWLGVERD